MTEPIRQTPAPRLQWGLCVSTLNRINILQDCVKRALSQTRPPSEIVIVDASEEWEQHRDRIAELVRDSGIPLRYEGSTKRSLTAQRNQGLNLLTADIAFLLDDDALMHPDCAETIMQIYERDTDKRVVGVSATNARGTSGAEAEKKNQGGLNTSWARGLLKNSALARWVLREILMTARDRIFIRYDDETGRAGVEVVEALGLEDVQYSRFLPGWGMTVRSEIALQEPFDDTLLAYCPTEDLDASYRFARYGVNVVARRALLDHVEVAAGRIKRHQAAKLSIMNSAYLTRKNSTRQAWHITVYYVYAMRRLLAEALKDTMTGRLSYPQFRGLAAGLGYSMSIFRHNRDDLESWYEAFQKRILTNR
ncbi:MAG: glycosyltransferase [Pseudomonadota bacterium]